MPRFSGAARPTDACARRADAPVRYRDRLRKRKAAPERGPDAVLSRDAKQPRPTRLLGQHHVGARKGFWKWDAQERITKENNRACVHGQCDLDSRTSRSLRRTRRCRRASGDCAGHRHCDSARRRGTRACNARIRELSHISSSDRRNGRVWRHAVTAVSYTHLTLPTICSV